jgi:hypothetical protein
VCWGHTSEKFPQITIWYPEPKLGLGLPVAAVRGAEHRRAGGDARGAGVWWRAACAGEGGGDEQLARTREEKAALACRCHGCVWRRCAHVQVSRTRGARHVLGMCGRRTHTGVSRARDACSGRILACGCTRPEVSQAVWLEAEEERSLGACVVRGQEQRRKEAAGVAGSKGKKERLLLLCSAVWC